jgi:O-antigen/teichoic acid export membrane protein
MKIRGIKANFFFNVLGPLAPLVVSLITVPIYVSHIGAARYGLLSITWMLLGYFGFLDLGLTRASANALAKLGHSSSREARANILVTAFSINLFLGVVGGVIFYVSGMFLIEHLLTLPAELKPEVDKALPWISFLLPLALVVGPAGGALESRERFLAANVLQVMGTTVGLVLPVISAVFISPSLSVVIPTAVLSRALSILVYLGFVFREEGPLSLRNFDRTQCRTLLSYGGWISVSNIVGPLLATLDQLVIGSVLGVVAVAHYSVPMSLVVRSQILAVALSRTLFPRMSRSTRDEATKLAEKALLTLAYGYGAVCAPAIVLVWPFLGLWMGKEFGAISGPIAELLLIGAWTNGLSGIFLTLLTAQGRPDIVAKVDALEIIPFIILLWFLSNHFGLLGAAAAWTIMVTCEAGILFLSARLRVGMLLQLIPPFGFIFAAYLFVCFSSPTILNALLASGVLGAGVAISAMIFDPNSREFVTSLRFPIRSQRAN